MESVTIFLTDPDADNYPFPYQIGDRLKSPTKNIQGTVRNAKYAGPKQPGPSWLAYYLNDGIFWVTYYLETDNGQITQIPQTELEEIGVDIMIEAGSVGGLILTKVSGVLTLARTIEYFDHLQHDSDCPDKAIEIVDFTEISEFSIQYGDMQVITERYQRAKRKNRSRQPFSIALQPYPMESAECCRRSTGSRTRSTLSQLRDANKRWLNAL